MAKKVKAKIYGVAAVPCVRTGKSDHVLDVQVGDYIYPLHITELWKEVKDDSENRAIDESGPGTTDSKATSKTA